MFIIISILIFGLIIAVHELGHFIAAKTFRVGVPEFAIGMGPKLLKKQGKETLYSLRAVPIGGFCALDGDDNDVAGDKSLFAKPLWQRLVIFLSGSLMNIAAGFLILFIIAAAIPALSTTTATLSGLMDGFPLEGQQGFLPGDTFHRIDGLRVYQNSNIPMFLDMRTGDTVDIVVIRDGEQVHLNNLPLERQLYPAYRQALDADGAPLYDENGEPILERMRTQVLDEYGEPLYEHGEPVYEDAYHYLFGFQFERIEHPTVLNYLSFAFNNTRDFMRQLPLTVRMFATGQAGIQDVNSVVGIVDIMHQAGTTAPTAADAALRLAMLAALISVSVAVVNLLPIPGLDGGRIFLMLVTTAIEKVTRRKVNPKFETYINMAGLVLLLGLMIFVIFNDIVRIASR